MAFSAGSAYSSYTLSVDGVRRGVAEAKRLFRELQADAQRLNSQPLNLGGGAGAWRGLDQTRTAASRALREFQQLERTFDRTRDSEIAAARAAGDHTRALSLLDAALGRAEQGSVRYNQLLGRQATAQRQATQEAERAARVKPPAAGGGGTSLLGSVGTAAGAVGIGFGVAELGQQALSAGRAALSLQRVQNVVRELTGTQARYDEVLKLAKENQLLFGGSLEENISNLTGFAVAARRSGVAIETLNQLSQRLAIISPEQGAAGASIAINEALSGNVSSLVKRFEIPKELLAGIEDSSLSAAQKLAILDTALTKSGVSLAAVKAAADPASIAYNTLAASFETARLNAGAMIAQGLVPTAEALTTLLGVLNGTSTGAGDLAVALSTVNVAVGGIVNPLAGLTTQISTLDEYLPGLQTGFIGLLSPVGGLVDQVSGLTGYVDDLIVQLNLLGVDFGVSGAQAVATGKDYERMSLDARDTRDAILELRAAQNVGIRPEDIGGGVSIPGAGKSNRPDVDQEAVLAFNERQTKAADDIAQAQRAQDHALASTAGRVKLLRGELAQLTPGTAAYITKQTELRQAENQLAAEQEAATTKRGKASDADEKRRLKEERTLEAQERKTDTALDQIENRYEDHYRKLAQLQDDYELGAARDEEDFQRQKQRLLAQGQRKEAELLEEEFRIGQRRKQEDFARTRAKEDQDLAFDVQRTSEKAEIRGVVGVGGGSITPPELRGLPTGAPVTSAAGALPVGAAAGAGGRAGMMLLRVEIAPASVMIDGERVALASWPTIEQLVDLGAAEALITIGAVAPPNAGQAAALGGGRP